MIPVNTPQITQDDILAVVESLEATQISGESSPVGKFEETLSQILGTKHSISVSSGSSAIDILTEALDFDEKDEVVVPDFTIISTVSNLMRKGVRLRLIDADPLTWSMDSSSAVNQISNQTRAIFPVHIYGLATDMDPILNKGREKEILVIEDAAEALGVNYKGKPCGSLGDSSIFSFYANKIVTGGEGGAICTDDSLLADRVRFLRNLAFEKTERFVHNEIAWNSRWNGLSASLARSQLLRLDKIVERKKEIAGIYLDGLQGHPWFQFQPQATEYSENVFWVFGLLLNSESPYSANQFREALKVKGIDSRRFFCPIHLQPVAKKYNVITEGRFPISEMLWERGVYIPSGIGISNLEQEKVIETLWKLTK